jgi:hypothetical protein
MDRDKAFQRDRRAPVLKVGHHEELIRAKLAAVRLYKNYPNVVGISTGTKYVKSTATDNHASIQFYVREKGIPKNRKGRALPRFVYGRFKNGRIKRKLKFTTDVIEVGRVRMVYGSGSPISSVIGLTRQDGTITFAFQNKAKTDKNYYVVSCAHVIGDIDGQSDIPVIIESESFPGIKPFATITFSSVQDHNLIEYDIAIAQVNSACLPLPDLNIVGTNVSIRSFMPKDRIIPSLPISCMLPVSNAKIGVVGSHGGFVKIEYGKRTYRVENAWMVKVDSRVREGDSGGLIYDGSVAVGIVFAASKSEGGWAWFHPLIDAFEYVRKKVKMELKCL